MTLVIFGGVANMAHERNRGINRLPSGALIIAILLVGLCVLIMLLGIKELYDVVRYAVTALVVGYLGLRGLSGSDRKDGPHD